MVKKIRKMAIGGLTDALSQGSDLQPASQESTPYDSGYTPEPLENSVDSLQDKGGDVFTPVNNVSPTTPDQFAMQAASRGNAYKKGGSVKKHSDGGKINLGNCKVSTHMKSKKSSSW